jgi:hypothetical protein
MGTALAPDMPATVALGVENSLRILAIDWTNKSVCELAEEAMLVFCCPCLCRISNSDVFVHVSPGFAHADAY